MTSFFDSSWNVKESVAQHLRSKTPDKGQLSPAQQRKQWIGLVKEAIVQGNFQDITTLLAGKHQFKQTDLDVFEVLAAHYCSEICTLLCQNGLSLQINWNHYPHLLKQYSADFVERLCKEPNNCVFSQENDALHQTLWDGMSGFYHQSVRRAFAAQHSERERLVAVAYIRQLQTQFPQLTQTPYKEYLSHIASPLSWGLEENIVFLEQLCDTIDWQKHFPEHNNLHDVHAFFGLCERSPMIAKKYALVEQERRTLGDNSRKLAKCFEGKNGVASSYPAFGMVKWIKMCSRETQEQEFMDDVLLFKCQDHLQLGLSPKDIYLMNRRPHIDGGSRRTRHGRWDLPSITPLSWFHQGVWASTEIVDVMLQSDDGVARLKECLDDPSVLIGFLEHCSIFVLHHTLKHLPQMVAWRDVHNNSIGHYIALVRKTFPKGLAEVLIKSDPQLLTQPNRLGVSAVDIMHQSGNTTPMAAISKMLLAVNVRHNTEVQQKPQEQKKTTKRKM